MLIPIHQADIIGDIENHLNECLTVDEVAKLTRTTRGTVARWYTSGVIGRDGQRHKLTYTQVGGRKFVARSAVAEFFGALNPQAA